MTAAIQSAAQWLATTPRTQIMGPVVPALQSQFGLSAKQACDAIREAALIKARAL